MKLNRKMVAVAIAGFAVGGLAVSQVVQIIKVVGVAAAVKQFGPEINRQINKLSKHKDTPVMSTKVVPILVISLRGDNAIGAAQVMGPKSKLDQVQAVAQPELKWSGITVRALIPVSSKDVIKDIKKVDGVGVSGIVDLKL